MPEVTNGNEVKDNPLSWSIWTKLFVFVVVVSIAAQVFLFLSFRQEIRDRRHAFCIRENVANEAQRDLWLNPKDGIFVVSQQARKARGEIETAGDRRREDQIRNRILKGFPIRNCDEF